MIEDALTRHPAGEVRSWITRSLRGILQYCTKQDREDISCFATRLETVVAVIKKDHPGKSICRRPSARQVLSRSKELFERLPVYMKLGHHMIRS